MTRIFTAASLQGRSLPDLRRLFRAAQQDLTQSAAGSADRAAALANLENIGRAIAHRQAQGPRF